MLVAVFGAWATAVPQAGAQTVSDFSQLSRELASPWPALQQPSGHLGDALQPDGSSRYGDAVAGLGILQTGVRDRDPRFITTGLRAVSAAARRVDPWYATRPFEVWAVAAAYNLAKQRLKRSRPARRALRRWAWWLKHQKTTYLQRGGYNNKYLVDAVAVLETQRTGLRSRGRKTILGGRRSAARRRAIDLVNRRIPAMGGGTPFILSDPVTYPPAYHALSYAFYARAAQLLGRRASKRSRAMLDAMGQVVGQMIAPDGDLAYWGRSMQQKWTLSAAAYGLATTAHLSRSPAAATQYRALAGRLLRRLQSYGAGPRGEWLTPSLRQDFAAGRMSLDTYARASEYSGLALVNLNWAHRLLVGRASLHENVAGAPGQALIGQGTGQFVTVRVGALWYAVRKEASGEEGIGDLRYDFGPVALKRLSAGAWHDVTPLRPVGTGSAGPLLLTSRGAALPSGESIVASASDGSVLIRGGFRHWDGTWVRRNVGFTVSPTPDGRCLRLSVGTLAGDRYEFSAFLRGDATPDVGRNWIYSNGQRLEFSRPISAAPPERGYHSASDALLTRQRVIVGSPRAEALSVTTC